MRLSAVLLLVLNLLVTAWLCGDLALLVVYLALGYAFVLHASISRSRLSGPGARVVPCLALAAWMAVWIAFKPDGSTSASSWVSRIPHLGLAGPPIRLVGASYAYLKVHDLIRRAQQGEPPPTFLDYLLQMTFFPSILAGPISGPEPFARRETPSLSTFGAAMNRLLCGLLKLYVIVPLLEPGNILGARELVELLPFLSQRDLWLGIYVSALSFYFNFAGYTDLAIGFGLLMGVRLPENFASPLLSATPGEFWQRWHMSFTEWLRAHVFGPVSRGLVAAGVRHNLASLVIATTVTMTFCGLWHRFTPSLVLWGLYHAALVSAHQIYAAILRPRLARAGFGTFFSRRIYRGGAIVATFHGVALGWVLFLPLDAPLGDHLTVLRRVILGI